MSIIKNSSRRSTFIFSLKENVLDSLKREPYYQSVFSFIFVKITYTTTTSIDKDVLLYVIKRAN